MEAVVYQTRQLVISSLLYYVIFLNICFSFLFFILFICFHIIFLYATENPTLEDHTHKSHNNVPTPISPKNLSVANCAASVQSL